MRRNFRTTLLASLALAFTWSAAFADDPVIKPYFEFKKPKMITIPGDLSTDTNGAAVPAFGGYSQNGVSVLLSFEGISQYDGASFGRNFIPPDTMGAIGKTQYMETSNGSYAVFDKATGVRTSLVSDVAWWATAGQTGTNGDSRVMYNAQAQRWIAVAFGASVADLQIAVSDTSNALGGWKSTKFTGFAGGTADYPTLAIDGNAVYIGTNNFKVGCNAGNPAANAFCGTTLNVIPVNSLFSAAAPTTTNMKQFVTPYPGVFEDRGFAIQGVNSTAGGSTGTVIAASLFNFDSLGYKVAGLTPSSATGASTGVVTMLGEAAFTSPNAARQPSAAIPANQRIIDSLDERISASVFEANGRIYGVHTVDSTADGRDESRVHYFVLDKNTMAILDEGDIGQAGYDYYQGSLTVNSKGQVVIAYNRSGLDALTGKISVMASLFLTDANGDLHQYGDELLLKESLTDDYHNGSTFGNPAAGRQRWGDYSTVTLDPEDDRNFWIIGEFAREYNNAAGGHPGGTGGSRWGTWISEIQFAVPEPSSFAIILLALGVAGVTSRRRHAAPALAH